MIAVSVTAVSVTAVSVTARVLGEVVAAEPKTLSLGQVLDNLRGVVLGLLAALATCYLIYGGVLYLTAGGDPGQVERAKGALRSAAIGYGIAILAPTLMTLLKQIVGA